MCRIRCEKVMDGPGPNDVVVKVHLATGKWEEVVAPSNAVEGGFLETSSVLDKRERQVLVELPRESASGAWRLWVNEEDAR